MSSTDRGSTPNRKEGAWWGRFTLGIDERGLWQLGPMKLSLTRRAQEWSVEYLSTEEWREGGLVEWPIPHPLEGEGIKKRRFTFRKSPDSVHVRPAPPDRSLVVYPESAFHITGGESITLFCSIPLWIQVEIDGGDKLLDEAIDRPGDTWYGPNTRVGELCYATKTMARLDRGAIPVRAHRALTELHVRNRTAETMHLERVNLAVPFLSVYAMADGSLQTESITLERTSVENTGELEIGGPPAGRGVTTVTSPRSSPETGENFARAFTAWFG